MGLPRTVDRAGIAFQSDARVSADDSVGVASPDLHTLFQRHYASVWRVLRRFGVPPAELDDQAQEVFWIAARRLADLQPGREKGFLFGVAVRIASNVVRRSKAAPQSVGADQFDALADPRPSPEAELEQQQDRQLLDQVLDRMPLELRTAFVLFELEGISVSEIAELEGLPVGTASSRLRRARQEFWAISKRLQAALAVRGASGR